TEGLTTVEEVGVSCRAGTGCGSCQLLIREILDSNP
ncbi:MAG: (2Fe-2S)-binding protein, partial [Acidobacteria bacterium]|nr:(2Fe-2S)-binding protein [Acidobacteriota bacterium]